MKIKPAKIFQDGMVLQCGCPVAVWGMGEPGSEIHLVIQDKTADTLVKEDGTWTVRLPELTASAEETLRISGNGEEIMIRDIAIGEVWIAAGQSNMEFPLCYERYWENEKDTADRNLRFYDVPEVAFDGQEDDFDYSHVGVWRKAEGDDLKYFSAAGYYFQKELSADRNVPVGIVGCNWGGTRSCAWMSVESLKKVGQPWLELYADSIKGLDMERYWQEQHKSLINDRGNPNMDPFSALIMPRTPSMEEIGAAFMQMAGQQTSEKEEISGNMDISQILAQNAAMPDPKDRPGCLYEHMVKTLAPYTARGILWYQGESDDVPGMQTLYQNMLTALIGDWRKLWNDQSLPFLIVQLPGWKRWMMQENMDYITIRRCQEMVAKEVENTWLCSISDTGEEMDIHPKDKRTVGHRLALLARRYIYGEDILCDAPVLEKACREKGKIILTFANSGSTLSVKGNRVNELSLRQDDEELEFMEQIDGNQLILTVENICEDPIRVELAQCPWYRINLYNDAGISAIPFAVQL